MVDRLPDLHKQIAASSGTGDERDKRGKRPSAAGRDVTVTSTVAPFVTANEAYEPVRAEIVALERSVYELEQLHRQQRLVISDETERQFNAKENGLKARILQCCGAIKLAATHAAGTARPGDTMSRAASNEYRRQFDELMLRYRAAEKVIETERKDQLRRRYQTRMAKRMTAPEIEAAVEAEQPAPTMMEEEHQLRGWAAQTVRYIEERHQDIEHLEKTVAEVAEAFAQLAVLVDQQQTTIDRIGEHVDNARQHTNAGEGELVQAEESQRKARRRTCCLVVILLAVLVVIIAPVLATQLRKS